MVSAIVCNLLNCSYFGTNLINQVGDNDSDGGGEDDNGGRGDDDGSRGGNAAAGGDGDWIRFLEMLQQSTTHWVA